MPTRLYLAHDETAVYNPATRKGSWDKTASANGPFHLSPDRRGQGERIVNTENVATANYDVLVATWVSDPIEADVTISGTLDAALMVAESSADANMVLHLHVWVTQGDSDTVRGALLADYVDAAEWQVNSTITQVAGIAIPQQAVTSVAASAGDRIVVEVGFQAQNTLTTTYTGGMAAGGRTSVDCVGNEALQGISVQPHPWIELSATLAFAATYLYTANAAAPATPAAVVGSWTVDNKLDRHLARAKAGGNASRAVAETSTTNPTDGLVHRFVSDELAAQTISASAIAFMLRMTESATDADAFTKLHLYVMKPDGTSRGALLANSVDGTELSTSVIRRVTATLSSLAVLAGDRLVLEVGARFTNVTATSKDIDHRAGETSCDIGFSTLGTASAASTGWSGWVRFAQRLVFADEAAATVYTTDPFALTTAFPTPSYVVGISYTSPLLPLQSSFLLPSYGITYIPVGILSGQQFAAAALGGASYTTESLAGESYTEPSLDGESFFRGVQ